jgi:RimJ/RimL family protein N-acetyltransferase
MSTALIRGAPAHLRRVGRETTLSVLREQIWWKKCFLGLSCELDALPEVRPAAFELRMVPTPLSDFHGFERELGSARGRDYVELLLREQLREAGVETLFVGAVDGAPAYVQWLVRPSDQELIHAHSPGRYARLADDEVLLEGAYTFETFRRMGAMADGMAQLLAVARNEGMRRAITYVASDNIPSLRGCAAVGFDVDHSRWSIRRLGRRRTEMRPLDDDARSAWDSAVKPRSA